jgi:hypothetical protein
MYGCNDQVTPMEKLYSGVNKVSAQMSVVRAFMSFGSKNKLQQVVEMHRRKSREKGLEDISKGVVHGLNVSDPSNASSSSPNRAVSGKYFPKLFAKNEDGSSEMHKTPSIKATFDNTSVKSPAFMNSFMFPKVNIFYTINTGRLH